jgi:hypothetical protein
MRCWIDLQIQPAPEALRQSAVTPPKTPPPPHNRTPAAAAENDVVQARVRQVDGCDGGQVPGVAHMNT